VKHLARYVSRNKERNAYSVKVVLTIAAITPMHTGGFFLFSVQIVDATVGDVTVMDEMERGGLTIT